VPDITQEFLTAATDVVDDALKRFGTVRLRALGTSMYPAIQSGDVLTARGCACDGLRAGDVVLARAHGRVIAHRVRQVSNTDGQACVVTRGDAHWRDDQPIRAQDVLGLVVAIERDGRPIQPQRLSISARVLGLAFNQSSGVVRRLREAVLPRKHENTKEHSPSCLRDFVA
jgi:signal peptidase